MSAGAALVLGIAFALILGNPFSEWTRSMTHRLLQISIIGLGAGMNLNVVGQVGLNGFGYTAIGICATFALGLALGRVIQVDGDTSLLVTAGTAICGGSAIAAVASTIRAQPHVVSVSLATVFFLNAMALFLFPWMGHYFNLSQDQFGLWSALAIHDTSSVVGSAIQYGSRALEVATTIKLARALWIIPVSFVVGALWKRKSKSNAVVPKKYPWFILGFLFVAGLVTWIPSLQSVGLVVSSVAKKTMVLTLFFIGSGLTRATIRSVGLKPFIQGVVLWAFVGMANLGGILKGWIQ